jgi:hypothetical protein
MIDATSLHDRKWASKVGFQRPIHTAFFYSVGVCVCFL